MTLLGNVDDHWFQASSPPPGMYWLPDEDEDLKGNVGAVRKMKSPNIYVCIFKPLSANAL